MANNIKREVLQHIDESGETYTVERFERLMPVAETTLMLEKSGCGTCPHYGKNFSCPPFSPSFAEYIKDSTAAKVICYRVPLEHFKTGTNVEKMTAAYLKVRSMLEGELLAGREADNVIAGSGHCRACPECAAAMGEKVCRYPGKMIYSLESMGINVVALTEKAFNIKIEWSDKDHAANYVTAVGAVFF